MQIVISNKNYSSWSMRPWVLAREAGILFEEVQLKFDESSGGLKVADIECYGVAGKVPVLVIDGEPVWDSLAICETLAERFPEKQLWPSDARARQVARSICAESHAGFEALPGGMAMNVRSRQPGKRMNANARRRHGGVGLARHPRVPGREASAALAERPGAARKGAFSGRRSPRSSGKGRMPNHVSGMSAFGREATAWKDGRPWRQSLHFRLLGHFQAWRQSLHFRLLGHFQGVVHFNP